MKKYINKNIKGYIVLGICFFFYLLNTGRLLGQEAKYYINISGTVGHSGSCKRNEAKGIGRIEFTYGRTSTKYIYYEDRTEGLHSTSFDLPPDSFQTIDDLKSIEVFGVYREKNSLGTGCSPTHRSVISTPDLTKSCISTTSGQISKINANYTITIKPAIILATPSASEVIFTDRDPIVIDPIEGIADRYWNWQYSTDGITWKDDLPATHQKKNSLTITGAEFLTEEDFGKTVFIRVNTGCTKSNIITYDYRQSAPYISSHSTTKPSCFDSENGMLRIHLDRELIGGELLSFEIRDWNGTDFLDDASGLRYDVIGNINNYTIDSCLADPDNGGLRTIVQFQGLPNSEGKELELLMLAGDGRDAMYYTGDEKHKLRFEVGKYEPVTFEIDSIVDVWCYDGADAEIHITASGGVVDDPSDSVGQYYEYQLISYADGIPGHDWTRFDHKNQHLIRNLKKGRYKVMVRDSHTCPAKEQGGLGGEVQHEVYIDQPEYPMQIEEVFAKAPTAFAWQDAYRSFKVTGGSPKADGSYHYELREGAPNGALMNVVETTLTPGGVGEPDAWYITFYNLKATDYFLTIKDEHWQRATDRVEMNSGQGTCAYINYTFTETEPALLEASLSRLQPIFCNQNNRYNSGQDVNNNGIIDEVETGAIHAQVKGGIRKPSNNGGLAYRYLWEKQNTTTGTWEAVSQVGVNHLPDSIHTLAYGNYRLNIEDANGVYLGNYIRETNANGRYSYSLQDTGFVYLTLTQPPVLEMYLTATEVYCKGGADGTLKAHTQGGTPFNDMTYTYRWSTGAEGTMDSLHSLFAGVYHVYVEDSCGCRSLDTIEVIEPEEGLSVIETDRKSPTAYGWEDASLTFEVSGASPFADGTYTCELKEGAMDGHSMAVSTREVVTDAQGNSKYQVTFHNLKAADYYLFVTDANYADAQDLVAGSAGGSCGLIGEKFTITQPDSLAAQLYRVQAIYCNDDNAYNSGKDMNNNGIVDEYETGHIQASVSGGVPFQAGNNGLPYEYHWQHQNPQTLDWETVRQADRIHLNHQIHTLTYGEYRLHLVDANGIILGNYERIANSQGIYEYQLIDTLFASLTLPEPPVFKVSIDAFDITCENGSNGKLIANIIGGTPNANNQYQFEWSTGDDSSLVLENQLLGKYMFLAYDSCGCRTEGFAEIKMPNGIEVNTVLIKHPSCPEGKDGEIKVLATGDHPPFSYEWDNGFEGEYITGLSAGNYALIISDSTGCNAFKRFTLVDPERIPLDLPDTVTLCVGYTYDPDIAIEDGDTYTYTWSKDDVVVSQAPNPSLYEAGTYVASISNAHGCSVEKHLHIVLNEAELNPEFMMASHAVQGESIMLVNVSNPEPERRNWILPEQAKVIAEKQHVLEIVFEETGHFELGLQAFEGACEAAYFSTITITEKKDLPGVGDATDPFIEIFSIAPNPNNGVFEIWVQLAERSSIRLSIFSIDRTRIETKEYEGEKEYKIPYQLQGRGLYLIVLETPQGRELRKILVQ